MKSSIVAFVSAALLIGTVAIASNANAIGRITNVYTWTGGVSGPSPAKGFRGSYVHTQVVWSDGIEHNNEVGTQLNTVFYVTGIDQLSCHNALIAAVNTYGASSWTDCTAY